MRRTIATVALVIAAMALGRVITDFLPTEAVADQPFFRAGSVGKPVSLDYADVTVTDVHVSTTISGNPSALAGGRWLVIDVAAIATTAPTVMAGFFLVDDGDQRWIASTRGPDCSTSMHLSTGVRQYASICFDIPKEALAGARLMATRGPWNSHEANFRRDDVAEISLGTKATDVDRLWDQKEPVDAISNGPVPPEEKKP